MCEIIAQFYHWTLILNLTLVYSCLSWVCSGFILTEPLFAFSLADFLLQYLIILLNNVLLIWLAQKKFSWFNVSSKYVSINALQYKVKLSYLIYGNEFSYIFCT